MSNQQDVKAAQHTAQVVKVIGAVIFLVGAILAKIGTTNIALFVFYIVLVAAGAGIIALGQSMFRKTLG